MIKLFLLVLFLLLGSFPLKADEVLGGDQEFIKELDIIKNPFEDGFPKPIVIKPEPIHPVEHKKIKKVVHKKIVVPPEIKLPGLDLQGVMVGEDMHQAIINDEVVPLYGSIEGARVDSITKQGVEVLFKGKKFFLKVD
jgi:hypothetical protein